MEPIEDDIIESEPTSSTLTERLLVEFCPPLDSSLLLALLSDYTEPINSTEEAEIRELLHSLAGDPEIALNDVGGEWEGEDSMTIPSISEVESALLAWSLEEKVGIEEREEEDVTSSRSEIGTGARLGEEEDDPIKFLASLFKGQSAATLRSRLDDALLDIETVVELLLNEDFIKFNNELNASSSSNSSSSTSSSYSTQASSISAKSGSTKQQRRRIKSSFKSAQTINLTDVLHRASPIAPLPIIPSVTTNALSAAPKSRENSWITLDSTSSYLASLLRISPARITSTYHRLDSSLPLTVSKILISLANERTATGFPPSSLASLRIVLPTLTTAQLELLLSATEGDVSDSIDLQSFLEELERKEGSLIQNGLIGFGIQSRTSEVLNHGVPTSPQFKKSSNSNDWKTSSSTRKRYNLASSSTPLSLTYSTQYSAEECQTFASEYHTKRNEAYRSAARHFQKGNGSERGAAWYWADVGRDMDRRKRGWEEKAAFATVGERRKRDKTDVDQVDLHGLTLNHALSVVKETCNTWYSSSSGTPAPLRIITGIGRHSTNQNPILMPAVARLLDKEGWRWKWDGLGGGGGGSGALLVMGVIR